MKIKKLTISLAALTAFCALAAPIKKNVVDEVAWIVGDEPIFRSEIEEQYMQVREQLMDVMRTSYITDQVQSQLTKNVKGTPNEVRKYFDALPEDSIPYIPMQVEAQIISVNPVIPQQEIDDVKARLRDYSDRVNKGEAEFSTLAILYSEDGSNMQGGELGFHNRADFVPEFSNVAFNLNDPKKVSRIVETEYGYHIIQLIEKRGDQVNVRHILLTPKVSGKELTDATVKLDSLRKEIVAGKFTFDEAARFVSQDKDTKNNRGVMMNMQNGSTRFEMQDLPPEVARKVELMQPGDISEAFIMKDQKKNRDVVAIVKLSTRIPGHKATLADDFNLIKQMYENHEKEKVITRWVEQKIQDTYVKISDGWDKCEFRYKGWIH